VLSAAHDVAWVGIGCVVILLVLHLRYAAQPVRELRLAALIVLCAAPWETALVRTGLVVYSHGVLWPGVVPPWLLGLWGLFAIQLNVLFRAAARGWRWRWERWPGRCRSVPASRWARRAFLTRQWPCLHWRRAGRSGCRCWCGLHNAMTASVRVAEQT